MRIKWENIIPLILIITLIVLLVKLPSLLNGLSSDYSASYGRSSNPVVKIGSLGLICITVLGIFKIISNSKR